MANTNETNNLIAAAAARREKIASLSESDKATLKDIQQQSRALSKQKKTLTEQLKTCREQLKTLKAQSTQLVG